MRTRILKSWRLGKVLVYFVVAGGLFMFASPVNTEEATAGIFFPGFAEETELRQPPVELNLETSQPPNDAFSYSQEQGLYPVEYYEGF